MKKIYAIGNQNTLKDIMMWKEFILIALSLASLQVCNGRRLQKANYKRPRDALCSRSHIFNREEACNTAKNCKFGGICRKVADFKTHRATLRVIVPSHHDDTNRENLFHRRVRRRATSRFPLSPRTDESASEECVCSFSCGRRFSQTGSQLKVCGSNGKTYPSECHLKREACRCQTNITIESHGTCKEEIKSVVGVETKNNNEADKSACNGECKFGSSCDDGVCRCNIECFAQTLSYVCGEDGRTYSNECHVKQAECRKQRKIGVLHTGPCSGEEKLRRKSTEALMEETTTNLCDTSKCDASDPLCGNDGISYPNECVIKHASCIKGERIEIKHKGYCRQQIEVTEFPPIYPEPIYPSQKSTLEEPDPCAGIYCTNGAVCVKHKEYGQICSCDEICNRMVSDTYVNDSFASSFHRSSAMAAFWPSDRILHLLFKKPTTSVNEDLYKAKTFKEDGTLEYEGERYPDTTVVNPTVAQEEEPVHDIIRLDLEKEVRAAWAGEDLGVFERRRNRRRRNRNSRNRRRRSGQRISSKRTKRSASGMRPLYEEAVCGTDGKTYSNECELRKEACHSGMRIVMAHRGACPIMLKGTESTKPETVSTKTQTRRILQQRDEIVKTDDVESLYSMDRQTESRNSKNEKKSNRRKGLRRNQRNRDKNKSNSRKKLDIVYEQRDETVNSSYIFENFNLTANPSVLIVNTTKSVPNRDNASTAAPTIQHTSLKTREVTLHEISSLVSLQTTKATKAEDNSSLPRPSLMNNKISVPDVQQRSEKVDVKSYQSLWKTSKKQKILNLASHNRTDNANNDSSKTSSKSDSGISIVVLGIVIGLGQVFVIGILVGIFIYMKKRKKFKEMVDTKVKPNEKTEEKIKNNLST